MVGGLTMTKLGQDIVPHLWYDKEAVEAAEFYTSIFPKSKITNVTRIYDTPSGDCDQVSFELWGQKFMSISAGPHFKFNPSISFMVNFDPSREEDASEKIEEVWNKLSVEGTVNLFQTSSIFSLASSSRDGSKLTINEIDGLNLKCGPALIDINFCPQSSNET